MTSSAETVPAPAKPRRSRRPQQRAVDNREKILAAAVTEFAAHGFEGASTRKIAQAAGVQYTLLTYHFQSKDRLWQEAIVLVTTRLSGMMRERIAGLRGVDEVMKLRLVLEEFIRFAAANPEFHWLMSHVASRPSDQLDWLMRGQIGERLRDMAEMIRRVQETGHFVQGNPVHLHYLFVGAVTRIFMLSAEVERLMGRSPFEPDFLDEHVRVVLDLFFRTPVPPVPAASA